MSDDDLRSNTRRQACCLTTLAPLGRLRGDPVSCTAPHGPPWPSIGPRTLGASYFPRCAVDSSVARPNLYRVVMRPLFQHRVCPINCVEERARLNLLVGLDLIATIKKMASVEGHKVLRLSSSRLPDGSRQSSQIRSMAPRQGRARPPKGVPLLVR